MTLNLKKINNPVLPLRSNEIESIKDFYKKHGINAIDRFNRTLLMNAAMKGNFELLSWAIQQNADLDRQDKKGMTALHMAVERNQLNLVSMLLKSGIKVDLQDHFGNTALWRAMMDNVDVNIVYLLLQYDANPDLPNNYGISARELISEENRNWELLKRIFDDFKPTSL